MDTQYGEAAPPPADPYAEAYTDQPSGAALDLGQVISRTIPATDRCIGPGDAA